MGKFLKFIIIVAMMAAIVIFWVKMDWFGVELTARVGVVGGGASLFLFGLLYKLLGTWDLFPDWVPILGKIDDAAAWVLMLLGIVAGLIGWFAFA